MNRKLWVVVAMAVVGAGLYVASRKRGSGPQAVPESSSSAVAVSVPPSEYPLCREVEAFQTPLGAKLGCQVYDAKKVQQLCELVLLKNPACRNRLASLVRCSKAQPISQWRCGRGGVLELKGDACSVEVAALRSCTRGDSSPDDVANEGSQR